MIPSTHSLAASPKPSPTSLLPQSGTLFKTLGISAIGMFPMFLPKNWEGPSPLLRPAKLSKIMHLHSKKCLWFVSGTTTTYQIKSFLLKRSILGRCGELPNRRGYGKNGADYYLPCLIHDMDASSMYAGSRYYNSTSYIALEEDRME